MSINEVNRALAAIAAKRRPKLVLLQRNCKGTKTSLAERLRALKLMKQIRSLNAQLNKISP